MQHNYTTASSQVNSLFHNLVPEKIKCTNNKQYQWARWRKKLTALRYEQIYVNDSSATNIIALDLDRSEYVYDLNPLPNIATYNADNQRCHLLYFLETTVYHDDRTTKQDKAYYNSVCNGLTEHLGADPSYNHTFTKNPLHGLYNTFMLHARPWSLDHLAEYVKPLDKKIITPRTAVASGRNCHMFDTVRYWAYKAIKEFKKTNQEFFHRAVYAECKSINSSFGIPLPDRDLRATAKSITNWVWNNYNVNTACEQGRLVSLEQRQMKAEERRKQALELLCKGYSLHQIATAMKVSYKMVHNWLNTV